MYRMELALILVMDVNDLHARFIRLLYLYVKTDGSLMFKVIIISCLTTVLIMLVQTGSKKLSNNVNTTCRHRIMTTRPARDTCLSPR